MKSLLTSEQERDSIKEFVGENISLLARNVTDNASRHGEHYIAADKAEWWGMAKSAAGGGIIIAIMALIKLQLARLHLPPLTEGIAFGLNYGIGFVLIHLLGYVVATKQPAMTTFSSGRVSPTLPDWRGSAPTGRSGSALISTPTTERSSATCSSVCISA